MPIRLRALVSSLSLSRDAYEDLITDLEGLDITTADDLVLRYAFEELLPLISAAKANPSRLKELCDAAVASLVPDPVLGSDLYATESEFRLGLGDCPQVGVINVDSGLCLPLYGIVEVAGLPNTGKTLLVLQTVLNYLLGHPRASAHWIDPLGVFSPEGASQVTRELVLRNASESEDVLSRLQIAGCTDLAAVYDILDGITSQAKTSTEGARQTRFIVIDPITPLLGPGLTNESSKGHANMVTFMRHLASVSRELGLVCFLINTATKATPPPTQTGKTPPPTTYKPSLGPSYSYLTDTSLFLSRASSDSRRDVKAEFQIKVTKFGKANTLRSCKFRIGNHGLIE